MTPYANVPDDKQDAMERCVMKLVDEGTEKERAIAICYTSVVGDKQGAGSKSGGEDTPPQDVYFGDSVKALNDNGKVGGYLVRYGADNDPDLTGDYFTKDTDFGEAERLPVLYQHGFDEMLKRRKIGVANVRKDEVGLWVEAQLELRDDYEKQIFELAKSGKLGWSSGTAAHVVERENTGKAAYIKQWFLAEASLTPTPAEYRNSVVSIKSLAQGAGARESEAIVKSNSPMEETEMDETKLAEIVEQASAKAADEAVKKVIDALPENKSGFSVKSIEVEKDEADQPFESVAHQLKSIKNASLGGSFDPRLKRLSAEVKAPLGLNEGVPSQGAFLLDPQFNDTVMEPVFQTGAFTRFVNRQPTNRSYGYIKAVDETDLSAGQVFGGVEAYWRPEAGSVTATKPKFRRVNWELKSLETLMYITDEELEDAPMVSGIAQRSAARALDFKLNNALLRGDGVGKPLGILNAPSLVTVTRQDASNVLNLDILNMWQRMHPAHRANSAWFINSEVEPELDQLYLTTSLEARYITYGADGVMRMKGRPVYVTEFNAALGSVGDIVLADFSDYMLFQRDMKSSINPWIQWLTGEQAFKWTLRVDGLPSTYSAVTPAYGTNTQSPYVALSATS